MKINYYLLTIFWVQQNSKTKKNNNKPPTTIDQNGYCWKLAPISAYGNNKQQVRSVKEWQHVYENHVTFVGLQCNVIMFKTRQTAYVDANFSFFIKNGNEQYD